MARIKDRGPGRRLKREPIQIPLQKLYYSEQPLTQGFLLTALLQKVIPSTASKCSCVIT